MRLRRDTSGSGRGGVGRESGGPGLWGVPADVRYAVTYLRDSLYLIPSRSLGQVGARRCGRHTRGTGRDRNAITRRLWATATMAFLSPRRLTSRRYCARSEEHTSELQSLRHL